MTRVILMAPPVHRLFQGLENIVDEVHDLFDDIGSDQVAQLLDPFSLQVARLAVHEWIANLVQHAEFRNVLPVIRFTMRPDGNRVRCRIEDNSSGFDFVSQIAHQHEHLGRSPVPPERGRGLLMMIACTENISYSQISPAGGDGHPDQTRYRLEFWISPEALHRAHPEAASDAACHPTPRTPSAPLGLGAEEA